MSGLVQTFWRSEAVETASNRSYWTSRPWVAETASQVRDADILLLPWIDFGEHAGPTFPNGTTEFFKELREAISTARVEIAVDPDKYGVIALHSFELRWPTTLISASVLTIFLGILSTRIDSLLFEHGQDAPMKIEVIVEGDQGRCISIRYEGPARDFPEELLRQTERCLPQIAGQQSDDSGSTNTPQTALGKIKGK